MRPSRALLSTLLVAFTSTLLSAQSACFSAPAYRPDTETSVTPEDANSATYGITPANTNDVAQAAAAAATTLQTDPNAAPPANAAALIADPNGMADIDSNDFVPLVEAFGILYNDNAAAYYITLQQVVDNNLRGAIQYALNDTMDYHPATLRDNNATLAAEDTQFAGYWQAARADSAKRLYAAWAVPATLQTVPALTAEAPAGLPAVDVLIPQMSDHNAVVQAITAAAPANTHGVDGNAFAEVVIAMVPIYQTALVKYYQVLTQIPDKLLRDVVNFTVTDAVANHPTILTQSDGGAATFATESWPYYGQVGYAGTSQAATFTNISLDPNGPLEGEPYPVMQ